MAAASFPDLAEFIDPAFDLPYKGKTYRVPAPDATTGIYLQSIMDAGESLIVTQAISAADRHVLLDDKEERTTYQMALGSAYGEMVADKVPWPVLKVAGTTALLYWTRTPQMALAYWTRQGKVTEPEATEESPTSSGTSPSAL